MMGFKNPTTQLSVGGHALCISGVVDVTASAENFKINYEGPANQSALTDFLVKAFQVNSTSAEKLIVGKNIVSGTYGIYSQLCFPKAAGTISSTTVQFLTHGSQADRNYWNVAPGYSYADYAAEQGFTTFFYDRLGVGLSDHPDPIQTVQFGVEIAVAHELVQLLRIGGIANHTFEHVIGVSHSLGSLVTNVVTSQHPDDFDTAVLTGYSADNSGMLPVFAAMNLAIASQDPSYRFPGLPSGYIVTHAVEGIQSLFFREPFDPKLLEIATATKETGTVGEFLSSSVAPAVALNFTGPIYVVSGQYDFPGCDGNCLVPYNKVAAIKDKLYPASSNSSSWYIAPGSGHAVNYHYSAPGTYEQIHNFLKANGF